MASGSCRSILAWLCYLKLRTFLLCLGALLLFYIFVVIFQQVAKEVISKEELKVPVQWTGNFADVHHPVILWWTPFTGNSGETRKCGDFTCFFTDDRRFSNHSKTKMLVFYGTLLDPLDMPLPRDGMRLDWALLHEESPKNTPILIHNETLALFNFSATFSRSSSFPLTLQYLPSLEALTGSEFLTPMSRKKLEAPVVFIHSDCATPLDRDSYVTELMKHIRVDSLGKCVQNKPLPPHLADMTSMDSDDFLRLTARYLFALSFENARCDDYITEKLWRPLIVGSVPVYLGSPTVRDWLPNSESAILASDFSSPASLAKHLIELSTDSFRYEQHLRHKLAPPSQRVTNRRLIEAMANRPWSMGDDVEKGNFVEHYECFLCRKIHERTPEFKSVVSQEHYRCDSPVSPVTGRVDPANWWVDQWALSACEAKVLRRHVAEGQPLESQQRLQEEVEELRNVGMC